eukprot:633246-Rhodomonas_salina.2
MEHYAASCLAITPTRSHDSTRIVVCGCICAIGDAILRRHALTHPSHPAAILTGVHVSGKQLGIHGFGIGVSTFANQTETMELHAPEVSCKPTHCRLCSCDSMACAVQFHRRSAGSLSGVYVCSFAQVAVCRAALLDYFEGPAQKKLEKIFTWEDSFSLVPSRSTAKWLRLTTRSMVYQNDNPGLLADSRSVLLKDYPEIKCYRDIVFYWKYFLNPDLEAFPSGKKEIEPGTVARISAALDWSWQDEQYEVSSGLMDSIHCAPKPEKDRERVGSSKKEVALPTNRYPSTAL